jgi:hypothetical protein
VTSISNSAARYRGLSFLVLLTTAACGGHSADLGRYGPVDASPDPFETDSSTGTPKRATDAAADGSTDDGGIDVNTACLVEDNKLAFLEEPSLPVVIEGGTDWVIFVIDGLPSYLDIMTGFDWDAQFSTNVCCRTGGRSGPNTAIFTAQQRSRSISPRTRSTAAVRLFTTSSFSSRRT